MMMNCPACKGQKKITRTGGLVIDDCKPCKGEGRIKRIIDPVIKHEEPITEVAPVTSSENVTKIDSGKKKHDK